MISKDYRYDKIETALYGRFPLSNQPAGPFAFIINNLEQRSRTLLEILAGSEKFQAWSQSIGTYKILAFSIKINIEQKAGDGEIATACISYWPGDTKVTHGGDTYANLITANYNVQFTGRETNMLKKYIPCKSASTWVNKNNAAELGPTGVISCGSNGNMTMNGGFSAVIIFTLYVIGKSRLL